MGQLLCCPRGLNMEVTQLRIKKSMKLFRIGCPSPFRWIHFIATFKKNPKRGEIIFPLTANTLSLPLGSPQIEDIVTRIQDEKAGGVSIRTVKSFLSKIPSVVSGQCCARRTRLWASLC